MPELGGLLFIYAVLIFLPAWLFFIFGGWPCVAIFIGTKVLTHIASHASEWQ